MWIDRRLLIGGGAVSLLLNIFLVGIVIGHMIVRHHRPGAARPGVITREHVRALPPEERRAFNAALSLHRPIIRAARDKHRAARAAVEDDIAASAFDRGKLAADLGDLRKVDGRVAEAVDAALEDALAGLTPASRAALVTPQRPKKD